MGIIKIRQFGNFKSGNSFPDSQGPIFKVSGYEYWNEIEMRNANNYVTLQEQIMKISGY